VTRVFFDTNALVYAEDTGAGAKRDRSRQLILAAVAANTAVLSTQVLMEFYNVAVRRLKRVFAFELWSPTVSVR
jgi:predicted nucleic acid-binding protein